MRQAAIAQGSQARFAWLSNPTLFLCIAGVLLPNALSLGAILAGIGSPPRTVPILCYATVAMLARLVSAPVVIALYLAAVIYDAISTIALLFGLAPAEIGLALHLSGELKFFQSPLYMTLIAGLVAVILVNLAVLVFKRDLLKRGNPVVLFVLALVVAGADLAANISRGPDGRRSRAASLDDSRAGRAADRTYDGRHPAFSLGVAYSFHRMSGEWRHGMARGAVEFASIYAWHDQLRRMDRR